MISILGYFVLKNQLRINLFVAAVFLILAPVVVMASDIADTNRHQTNKNDTTDFFDQEIEDRQGLDSFLEFSRKESEQGVARKGAVEALGVNERELQEKAAELDSINVNSLESKGQEERAKEENIYYDSLEIDYTDPKILNHKKDIDKITDANEKLLSLLIEGLRDLGVDCKTVKGDKELEPEYALEIEKEHFNDVIYNKKICEELRNLYNCTDTTTLKCSKRGFKYGEWQRRTIRFPGHALHNEKMNWGFAAQWATKRWGWYITPRHPRKTRFGWPDQVDSCWRDNPDAIIADARAYIAAKLGVLLEQIRKDIDFPAGGRGIGGITPAYNRWRVVWDEYEFGYWYRDAQPICEAWSETWNEVCRLK
jgi:hypothetical protein